MLVAALAAASLAACGGSQEEQASDSRGGTVDGALPTPAGTSGGSVTGMPTTAPPPTEVEVAEAPPVPATAEPPPGTLPADPNAIPIDPATGLAVGTVPPADPAAAAQPVQPGDASAAGAVVREYMAALGAGSFAAAQQLWSATPTDSAILQLARGNAFAVDVLAPTRSADPAAVGVVTVPVRVRGNADDGSERGFSATYTVRRAPDGTWRIASATLREDAP